MLSSRSDETGDGLLRTSHTRLRIETFDHQSNRTETSEVRITHYRIESLKFNIAFRHRKQHFRKTW